MTDWTKADLTQNKHFNDLKTEVLELTNRLDITDTNISNVSEARVTLDDKVSELQKLVREMDDFLFQRFGYGVTIGEKK